MSTIASIMEPKFRAEMRPPEVPTLIFTLADQVTSVQVIEELRREDGGTTPTVQFEVFETGADVVQFFADFDQDGFRPSRAIVIFDQMVHRLMKHARNTSTTGRPGMPVWANGSRWGVAVRPGAKPERIRTIACQVRADYLRNFEERVSSDSFPWGKPRRGERGPVVLKLPGDIADVIGKLNAGIDFTADLAPEHAAGLPRGTRISCNRVATHAFDVDRDYLNRVMTAFEELEKAAAGLVTSNQTVQEKLLDGVIGLEAEVAEAYLFPGNRCFSVRRLDLHLRRPDSVFASENDEMPGGIAQAWWYDQVYGVNQERWRYALEWLTARGLLLFLVSHQWSEVYISEMFQMQTMLAEEGWPVEILTTDQLDQLSLSRKGASRGGRRIGTIWRQFPVFETRGKLAEIVLAASEGLVTLVPEFAHFGNKTWFSLFRENQDYFATALGSVEFETLDNILPDTLLVQSKGQFPADKRRVGTVEVGSISELMELSSAERNQLVLKVAGANTMAARSYGVLMGHDLSADTWRRWIEARLANGEPFIVQQAEPTEVRHEAVYNLESQAPEVFACRLLLRPWAIGGKTISGGIVGAIAATKRVHGMKDMFVTPVDLGPLG